MYLLLQIFFMVPVFAESSWTYTAFPVVEQNSPLKANEPEFLLVSQKKLRALMSRQSGTHRAWGVKQIYLSQDQKKKVFLKY